MGSYSVSCAVTGLSITHGDKCVMLPITVNRMRNGVRFGPKIIPRLRFRTSANIIYNTDMWVPAMLPIHGEYNDSGGIEEIIEDDGTRVLEERYELTIDEIIEIICGGRNDVYDSFSETYNVFFDKKEEYVKLFDEPFHGALGDAIDLFDARKSFILSLGIIKCSIVFGYERFTAKWENGEEKEYRYEDILRFFSYHYELTGQIVCVKKENIEKCRELMCTGAMFVLEEVWQQFAIDSSPKNSREYLKDDVSNGFLLNIGFVQDPNDLRKFIFINENGAAIGHVDTYEKEIHSGESSVKYGYRIDEFLNKAQKILGIRLREKCHKLYKGCDRFSIQKKNFIAMLDKGIFEKASSPVYQHKIRCESIPQLSLAAGERNDFSMLYDIYQDALLEYLCTEEYFALSRFCSATCYLNVTWAPTFSGSQFGCIEAEAKRAYITDKIVKSRIAEYAVGECDDCPTFDDEKEKGFWKDCYC